jgi:hypothetical protein
MGEILVKRQTIERHDDYCLDCFRRGIKWGWIISGKALWASEEAYRNMDDALEAGRKAGATMKGWK